MSALENEEVRERADLEELFGLVHELKDGVAEMKKGKMDEEAVQRIALQAMAASRRAGTTHQPEGFVPDDVDELTPRQARGKLARMHGPERESYVLTSDPTRVAQMMRRPAADIQAFQEAHDQLLLLSAMTKSKPDELDFYWDSYAPLRQAAMDTKTSHEGTDYLPPIPAFSTDIIAKLEGTLQVLALFPTINMPTNPFKFHTKGQRKHVAVLAEAVEAGTPKAKQLIPGYPGEISLTATKFAGEIITSKELEEEAAIALLPFLQGELIEWLRWDLEDACINGDTLNTMDAGVAADDPKTGWDGLRKSTPATAKFDCSGTTLDVSDVHKTRAKMGRYGLDPNGVVLLVSVPSLYGLITDTNVMTPDKYGSGATLISGELARVWGIPIIAVDQIPVTCNAAGVVPASPGTLTIAILVHRSAFMHGIRRNTTVQVLTELYAESDQDAVLMTTRQAFGPRWPGDPAIAQAINVLPS